MDGCSAPGLPSALHLLCALCALRRYNTMLADETGLTLTLLPMLLGFFTYKGAVLAKQSLVLFGELAGAGRAAEGAGSGAAGAAGAEAGAADEGGEGGAAALDVTSVDRAFAKRVLSQ